MCEVMGRYMKMHCMHDATQFAEMRKNVIQPAAYTCFPPPTVCVFAILRRLHHRHFSLFNPKCMCFSFTLNPKQLQGNSAQCTDKEP